MRVGRDALRRRLAPVARALRGAARRARGRAGSVARAAAGARTGKAAAVLAAASALGALALVAWTLLPLPAEVGSPPLPGALVLQDRHGLVLRSTREEGGGRGGWVPLDDVDPELIHAFLALEDHRFFEHHGVDARAVARAARDNLTAGGIVSGASTVTMQAARLLHPVPRSWRGKLAQALWALRLEAHRDKDWILEQYLNRVPLGQGTAGVAAAAALYFGVDPRDVSLGQAALLAGLARLPSRDNPLVAPARARERRELALERMAVLGYADAEDAARAAGEPVLGRVGPPRFRAPHFTTHVLGRAEEADGRSAASPSPHRAVRTTLDLDLQEALEAEVRHTVATLRGREARHAAAVVLDNGTGDVLAWVGSPDFWADSTGQVDMVTSSRQPGSTLKPFLYGAAFERGWTAATVLPDVPRTWATPTGPYAPQNYDRRFRGPVRARVALASSLNVPAVELAERVGPADFLGVLREAGFSSLDRDAGHYGLGLALGNGEVTLLELANAYRGLARGGVWAPVRWRADAPPPREWRRFLSPGATALVLDVLADPVARIPGFGAGTPLDFPFRAATKTGTSRHFTDNWAVATTERFTVAVWVGNFSGRPMRAVSGITGAGPLLQRAVLETARRHPPGRLARPEDVGAEPLAVCALSGLLPSGGCATVVEWFLKGTAPAARDDWEREGKLALPPEYADWAATQPRLAAGGVAGTIEGGAAEDARPRIVSPLHGDVYEAPVGVDARYATVALVATGPGPVRWLVDGRAADGARWRVMPGVHRIVAVWPSGARDSVEVRGARGAEGTDPVATRR